MTYWNVSGAKSNGQLGPLLDDYGNLITNCKDNTNHLSHHFVVQIDPFLAPPEEVFTLLTSLSR